jgi:hypothetical protein
MTRATNQTDGVVGGGSLLELECWIKIPGFQGSATSADDKEKIFFDNLPDITDSKSAAYNDEPVIGRSTPFKTYSHSENRTISMQIHLFVTKSTDIVNNLRILRAIESAAYPQKGDGNTPFLPPPVCKMQCGKILADFPLCVVLKSYSVKFPTDVSWFSNGQSYTPAKMDIDTSWDVVYRSDELPGHDSILNFGTIVTGINHGQ